VQVGHRASIPHFIWWVRKQGANIVPSPFRAFALLTTIGSLLFSLLNPGAHLSSDMHQDGEGVGGPQFHGNFTVTSGRFAGCISKVD
jgi:hypothetical protein